MKKTISKNELRRPRGFSLLEVSIGMALLGATLVFFTTSMGQDMVSYQRSRIEDSKISFVETVGERIVSQVEHYLEMAGTTEPSCDLNQLPFETAWKDSLTGQDLNFGGGVKAKLVKEETDLPQLSAEISGTGQELAIQRCVSNQSLNRTKDLAGKYYDSDFSKTKGLYFCLKLDDTSGEDSGVLEGVKDVFVEASYHRTYIHDPNEKLGVYNPHGFSLDCQTQSGIIPFPTLRVLYITLYWTIPRARGLKFMEYSTLIWSGGSAM